MRESIWSERSWKMLLWPLLLVYATICALAIGNWQRTLVLGMAADLDVLASAAIRNEHPITFLGEQAGAALLPAPRQVGINDALAVALRTDHAPVPLHDVESALPGELALPMSFRGELQGFALIGAKPNRGAYRADEIAALEHATQQVGLDLHALQTEQLQAELAGLRHQVGALNQAFERYAGRVA